MAETVKIRDFGEIQVLTGMEAVRKRPTMYVGPLDDRALVHLVLAVLSGGLMQAEEGLCTEITVTLQPDGGIEVADDGRAPWLDPVKPFKGLERTRLGRTLTLLHAGGTWPDTTIAVALSADFMAAARRGDKTATWWFKQGVKVEGGQERLLDKDGTVFQFKPDPAFFGEARIDREHLAKTLTGIVTTARITLRGPSLRGS